MMINPSPKQIKDFQKEIFHWYSEHKRDLPWRKDRNPYHILVSEVMLQQTQVPRVIAKYEAWLQAFPTLQSLATASRSEVLRQWSGLGYNRRALFLQQCAKRIIEDYKGIFPNDEKTLLSLPGIGEYTARAILCFAFDKQVAVIDTNVRKVIVVKLCNGEVLNKKSLEEIAQRVLPKGKAYEWNQALMDYASSELRKHKVPIGKQSTFKGSDRFFRGLTIKSLLKTKQMSFEDLFKEISTKSPIEEVRYLMILKQLEKDGFILRKNALILLSD